MIRVSLLNTQVATLKGASRKYSVFVSLFPTLPRLPLTTLCDVNLAVHKGGKLSFPFGCVNTDHLNTDEQPGHNNTLTSASISSALISHRAAPSPLSRCLRNSLKEPDVRTSAGSLKRGGGMGVGEC